MSKITRILSVSTVSILALASSAILSSPAIAADFPVTNYTELVDAINDANTNPGSDTITIDGTITLEGDLPQIIDDLTITGSGSASATIDGNDAYRTILITGSADAPLTVRISGLTVTHGGPTNPAIVAGHTNLVIDDVIASESFEGIQAFGGSVTISNSVATNNEWSGIYLNMGASSVSSLTGVEATNNGDYGIFALLDDEAQLELSDCVASDNGANGVEFIASGNSTVTATRTTATRSGGTGVDLQAEDAATLTMTDTTTTDNGVDGIHASSYGAASISLNTTTSTGNEADGLQANAGDGGTITVTTLLVERSEEAGMYLLSYDPGSVITVSGATVTNSTEEGALLVAYEGGSIALNNSMIQNNLGTGITITSRYQEASASTVRVTDTTVRSNDAANGLGGGVGGGVGGGIFIFDPVGLTVSLVGSTISDNTALWGGGIFADFGDDRALNLTIVNSTISGNAATTMGGIALNCFDCPEPSTSDIAILNSTIANNEAADDGPSDVGLTGDFPVEIRNTIIAGGLEFDGAVDPVINYSLIQNPGSAVAAVIAAGTGNLTGVDPKLGPLADNGGPTFTQLPADGSPAVNAGDPAFTGLATDQRGQQRVITTLDMGAVELQPALAATGSDAALPLSAGALLFALGGLALLRRKRHSAR